MNIKSAKHIIEEYYNKVTYSEEDHFDYTEALMYLIEKTQEPRYMMELGGYYYEIKEFDLAKKYYELAASYNNADAYECLGYIYYYGRIDEPDYKKAFECYSRAKDLGSIVAEYKVADMYKNGYYVKQDKEKYKNIIKTLYLRVKDRSNVFEPIVEIYTRLARLYIEEGKHNKAISLLEESKHILSIRIKFHPFFGNLSIMKWIIHDLYLISDIDYNYIDLYDCYEVLKKPIKLMFIYEGNEYIIESLYEDNMLVINFNNQWYKTIDDFIQKAHIDNILLTFLYDEISLLEVI